MSFALIDVGGTFVKAAVISPGEHESISNAIIRRPIPTFLNPSGRARELDPEALQTVIFETLAAAERLTPGATRPRDVFVTGQMAGIAVTDAGGTPLMPIVTWQDQRGSCPSDAQKEMTEPELRALGEGLRVGLPLLYLPALRVPRDATVTSLLGFTCGLLAGHPVSTIHATDAGAWGMVNLLRREWSHEAVEFAGLHLTQLPTVAWDLVPVGQSREFGWQVWCAVGDMQAALFGARLSEDDVSINLATGCQVSVRAQTLAEDRRIQTRPFIRDGYLHTRTHLPAGRLLREAVVATYGSDAEWSWERAVEDLGRGIVRAPLQDAVARITGSLNEAIDLLDPTGTKDLLWSGGVGQRFASIRDAVTRQRHSRVSPARESALAGLARLALRDALS